MYYYNEIERIWKELNERRDDLNEELAGLPDGEFYSCVHDGLRCYYERFPQTGNMKKEKRKGVGRDEERLMKLVRKVYVKKAVRNVEKDIDLVGRIMKQYHAVDENSLMSDFLEKYPELSGGVYYGGIDPQKWASEFKGESDYHKENLKSVAADGGKRRSLGELIIGARLDHYGIPYRYEDGTGIPGLPFEPDFRIIRPRDSKMIYWEHLGMVNDKEYMNYNKYKFEIYEEYGIVPWDNLIVSYSQEDHGINEKLIDSLIRGWLL